MKNLISKTVAQSPKMGLRREILEEIKKILQLENNLKTTFNKDQPYRKWFFVEVRDHS